jgi:uncharacterized protein YerC
MVRVNKNLLPAKDLNKLYRQFDVTLAKLDTHAASAFMSELLGPEERITIAKRLAAVVLLVEGYSEYKTAKLLKLSPTTTEKIATKVKLGKYQGLLKILGKSKKDYFKFLETLDNILHLGGILPHYNGLDRYRGL